MNLALEEAIKAKNRGEVPVGAVVVHHQTQILIAKAGNQMREQQTPFAHAEMLVLNQAMAKKQTSRLIGFDLYVTLEPCPMCAHAISLAKIQNVFYGAPDVKGGGVDHGPRLFQSSSCFHRPNVWGGINEKACRELIKGFFNHLR